MKMRLFIMLIFLCHYQAYGDVLTGMVVDSETNEPLFGVTVFYDGAPVAFSDDEGRFTLTLDNMQPQDSVFFRHISFHNQTVTAGRLRTDPVVRMESRSVSIGEVSVKPANHKKIINDIIAQYQKSAPKQPYWAKVHQTQTLTFRGEESGYVEYTGHILCMGRDIANAFIENQWIPEHVRRTKENPSISHMIGDPLRVRLSERLIDFMWLDYRFFDVAHPLGQFNKQYAFRIDSVFTLEGNDYWAISYQQQKKIEINFWQLSECKGQLWVDKNSNMLIKLSGNTNRDDFNVTQLTIDYGTFNHRVVPYEINMSVIGNQNIRKEKLPEKLLLESRVSFSEASDRQERNYKGDYNVIMPDMLIEDMRYELGYWAQIPGKTNIDFIEGANSQIYWNYYDERVLYFQKFLKDNLPIIQNEISKLTWGKIIPLY